MIAPGRSRWRRARRPTAPVSSECLVTVWPDIGGRRVACRSSTSRRVTSSPHGRDAGRGVGSRDAARRPTRSTRRCAGTGRASWSPATSRRGHARCWSSRPARARTGVRRRRRAQRRPSRARGRGRSRRAGTDRPAGPPSTLSGGCDRRRRAGTADRHRRLARCARAVSRSPTPATDADLEQRSPPVGGVDGVLLAGTSAAIGAAGGRPFDSAAHGVRRQRAGAGRVRQCQPVARRQLAALAGTGRRLPTTGTALALDALAAATRSSPRPCRTVRSTMRRRTPMAAGSRRRSPRSRRTTCSARSS